MTKCIRLTCDCAAQWMIKIDAPSSKGVTAATIYCCNIHVNEYMFMDNVYQIDAIRK
ncbi:MAG: hypothetical protein AABY07_09425 [Nanoarchaeota archaeon]